RSVPAIGARDRGHRDKIAGRPEALQRLEEAARGMWHAELYDRGLTRPDEWPGIAFERRKDITPAPAALSLLGRIHNLLEMEFWDRDDARSVQQYSADLAKPEHTERVLCLDLGSLNTPKRLFVAAGAALDALWMQSREEWTKALGMPASA